MKKDNVEYHPKFENVENKDEEEKRKIFEMIDEGGPVHLEEVEKEKDD